MRKVILSLVLGICLFICACSGNNGENTQPESEPKSVDKVTWEKKVFNTEDERFAGQPETDEWLFEAYNAGYSLDEALCVVDPYGQSPLTAVIIFETPEPTTVEVTVEGKDEASTIRHSFEEASKKHSVPIYGLYPGVKNKVYLDIIWEEKKERRIFEIETEKLPGDIASVDVVVQDTGKMAYGLTFFDCPHIGGNYYFAMDSNGDIRWYLSEKSFNGCTMLVHLKNGNFLIGTGEPIPDAYNNLYGFYEVTPLGQFVRQYNLYGVHHDIRELSNGNLICAASKEGAESQNDYIVELDRNTGEVIKDWDLMKIIPMTEYDTQFPYSGGLSNWLHNNAIWYIEDEEAFIISGRHQNMIMKFDANTYEIRWIMSATVGELNEKLRPYLLTPIGEDFEYPTSQHAAMQTPDGDLMLFDNRNFDVLDDNEELIQERLYSRAVRYHIDAEAMTVEQVWQYGKEEGTRLYSSFVSDVDYLGPEHYLIDFGGQYMSDEGKSYDHIHTDKKIKNASNRSSIVIEIDHDKVIFEAKIYGIDNANTYKAERKDIYQNAEEARFYDWEPEGEKQ